MARITKIDESIIDTDVWYLDHYTGICSVHVTGIYHKTGRGKKNEHKWGLFYDKKGERLGQIYSKVLYLRAQPVFDSRGALVRYYNKLLSIDLMTRHNEDLKELGIEVSLKSR